MKKLTTFIMIFIFIISLILSVYNVNRCIQTRNWYKTELTITFIGLPDGVVFGDYTDQNGVEQVNVSVYYDSSFVGNKTDTDKYIGKVVNIAIDPVSGKIVDHDRLKKDTLSDVGMFLISSFALILLKKEKIKMLIKRNKDTDKQILG